MGCGGSQAAAHAPSKLSDEVLQRFAGAGCRFRGQAGTGDFRMMLQCDEDGRLTGKVSFEGDGRSFKIEGLLGASGDIKFSWSGLHLAGWVDLTARRLAFQVLLDKRKYPGEMVPEDGWTLYEIPNEAEQELLQELKGYELAHFKKVLSEYQLGFERAEFAADYQAMREQALQLVATTFKPQDEAEQEVLDMTSPMSWVELCTRAGPDLSLRAADVAYQRECFREERERKELSEKWLAEQRAEAAAKRIFVEDISKPSPDLNFEAVMKTISVTAEPKYTFKANFHTSCILPSKELKLVTGKGTAAYEYRTPIEEKKVLDQAFIDQSGLHSKASDENRQRLLADCESGDAWGPMPEVGSPGEFDFYQTSLYIGGMAPTNDADFAVVSVPGSESKEYNAVLWTCAFFGIGLAVVFQEDFGGMGWYTVWRKNVELMVKAGKKLVVLAKDRGYIMKESHFVNGQIGFAQTMEIMHLREQKYDFVVVSISGYLGCLSPLESAIREKVALQAIQAIQQRAFDTGEFRKQEEEIDNQIFTMLNTETVAGRVPIVQRVNEFGGTPMMVATSAGFPHTIAKLHEMGEDVNQRSFKGRCSFQWTALFFAVQSGKASCVKTLLDLKAEVNITDQRGKTPLFYSNSKEITDLLKAAGASG